MHLATLMHSNHSICIIGVSRGRDLSKGGEILSRGRDFVKGARFYQGGRDFVKEGRPPPFAPP